jgi:hypothetical protein
MEIDEEDVEGDFDQKMKEMLSNYDGNFAVEDEEKPKFSDIDEEDDVEDWNNLTGGDGGANAEELNTEDSTWIVIFSKKSLSLKGTKEREKKVQVC